MVGIMDLTDQKPTLKSGNEPLINGDKQLDFSLLDFWRWGNSDLLSNAARGIFAEFLVATALGIKIEKPREEWATYDLITPDGIKVEVKSAAYLQSWNQTRLSEIKFGIGKTKKFDLNGRMQNEPAQRWADVYVFCLLAHQDKRTVNPLDVSQWEFYVVATKILDELCSERQSISLHPLRDICRKAILYSDVLLEVNRVFVN
ncbi:MAG TPA: hypothetical protein DIW44_03290 [Anaerolineaceae bacterium]|nr:hypothetical protein [Anaerolineaceae bacterium]